tara:strand:+ start:14589 stop:15128 length:540 start_codon:yes stop_codon:yes gene_type:complete
MSDYKTILGLFVSKIKTYNTEGVELAFIEFEKSLTEKVHAPKNNHLKGGEYIKTSLAEAAEAAKLPVYITVKKNGYGNMESTVYPGLIFIEQSASGDKIENTNSISTNNNNNAPSGDIGKNNGRNWVAHAVQDGKDLRPLDMNVTLVCQANGWRFDKNNLIGSAEKISSDLKVAIDINS